MRPGRILALVLGAGLVACCGARDRAPVAVPATPAPSNAPARSPSPTHTNPLAPSGPPSIKAAPSPAIPLPGPGSWMAVKAAGVLSANPRAAIAGDGRVLLLDAPDTEMACRPAHGDLVGSRAAIFDPRTGEAAPLTSPDGIGSDFGMATLGDGRILVVGGRRTEPDRGSHTWDPASGSWTNGPATLTPRERPALALLSDGRVLASGGRDPHDVDSTSTEIYDPVGDRWVEVGPLPWAPDSIQAVTLADGRVLVVGTYHDVESDPGSALFDPTTGTWTSASSPGAGFFTDSLVALPDGSALAINSPGFAARFDPGAGWRPAGRLLVGRIDPAVATLEDGRVLVAGGLIRTGEDHTGPWQILDTTELFDPGTGISEEAATLPAPRAGSLAILLGDGSVLVAGGYAAHPGDLSPDVCVRADDVLVRWSPPTKDDE